MTQPLLTELDLHLFNEGSHFRLYDKLGAQLQVAPDGTTQTAFTVWAPDAHEVFVTGDFNGWNKTSHRMHAQGQSGLWHGVFPGIEQGCIYKYHIVSRFHGYRVDKADPLAFAAEEAPRTGSVVWNLDYEWNDDDWMATRHERHTLHAPMSIYELHLGSWRRKPEEGNRWLTYREMAPLLIEYILRTGFTHVELLPIMEHPYYPSWGYQVTGFFAPTKRYGTPQDFMYLVDQLHQAGIGVILDWVPSHFPTDEHGLIYFDGTHLYEHADPRQGMHQEWGSAVFNYGRPEVRSFLTSSALFWLEKYHIDGLRVDAVASMLYLDYSRQEGEWVPNQYGGRENLDAVNFLRRLNEEVYRTFPDVQMIAEESTSWPMVSRPTYVGGLGFGLKWDMGWMHDTLKYMANDPVHRKFHHNLLSFRMLYAFTENFVLSLSHDEVVHGKGSLLHKMPGDLWQQFANLRLMFGYMWTQPGKKLLFMGGEIGQRNEWYQEVSMDWHLLDYHEHAGLNRWVSDLNKLYRSEPALHDLEHDWSGFEWVDINDADQSVVSFLRRGRNSAWVLVVCNFTPVPRDHYRVGVPDAGWWQEVLNSDAHLYGGGGLGNMGGKDAEWWSWHGRPASLNISVPPLGMVIFRKG